MRYILTFMAVIVTALLFTQCKTTRSAIAGSNDQPDREKALTGDKFNYEKDFELNFKLTGTNVSERTASIKFNRGYYETYYKRDGESNARLLDKEGARALVEPLNHIDMTQYYRENTANSTIINNDWTLELKQEGSNFNMHGANVNPEDFPIVNCVMSYFDYLFEYNESTTPFSTGKLLSFTYYIRGSMRPGGPKWELNAMGDGKYKLVFTDDSPTFMNKPEVVKEMVCDEKVGEALYNFMKEGRVQDYRSYYQAVGVMDGSSWSFSASFSDGKSYRSGGYMDGPRDRSGINKSVDYLEELLKQK